MSLDIPSRKPALRQPYRTAIGILTDILEIIIDAGIQGVMVSEISRKANLSNKATVENCQKLIEGYLIESTKRTRYHIFSITPKGIEFFQEFKRFQEIAQEMNLRY